MQKKETPQEIPCEYAIKEFPEYQNSIKITLVSSLKGITDCDNIKKGGGVIQIQSVLSCPKEGKMD